jgi:DNA (cytosine-5)-methyltransferase 1
VTAARFDPVAHEWIAPMPIGQPVHGSVVDIFCGAGGLTHGFLLEGFTIGAGIDIDEDCQFPFEQNNHAQFVRRDVAGLQGSDILPLFRPDQPRILVGCAACQPFSSYNRKNDDPKWTLLNDFASLIIDASPDIVSMENVPTLRDFRRGRVFADFVSTLEREGYWVSWKLAFTTDYGVPQR